MADLKELILFLDSYFYPIHYTDKLFFCVNIINGIKDGTYQPKVTENEVDSILWGIGRLAPLTDQLLKIAAPVLEKLFQKCFASSSGSNIDGYKKANPSANFNDLEDAEKDVRTRFFNERFDVALETFEKLLAAARFGHIRKNSREKLDNFIEDLKDAFYNNEFYGRNTLPQIVIDAPITMEEIPWVHESMPSIETLTVLFKEIEKRFYVVLEVPDLEEKVDVKSSFNIFCILLSETGNFEKSVLGLPKKYRLSRDILDCIREIFEKNKPFPLCGKEKHAKFSLLELELRKRKLIIM